MTSNSVRAGLTCALVTNANAIVIGTSAIASAHVGQSLVTSLCNSGIYRYIFKYTNEILCQNQAPMTTTGAYYVLWRK